MRRHDGRPLMIYRPSVVSTQPWQTSSDSPWLLFSQMQQHSTAHAHMTVWHRDGRTLLWLYLKRPTPSHTLHPLPISASNRVTFSKKDKVTFWTVHWWATTPVVHELICHRKASLWSPRAAIFCQDRRPKACVVCVCVAWHWQSMLGNIGSDRAVRRLPAASSDLMLQSSWQHLLLWGHWQLFGHWPHSHISSGPVCFFFPILSFWGN